MKKMFDALDILIALGIGAVLALTIASVMFSLGAPRIIIILVLALLAVALTALAGYIIGWRRAKTESLIAFNKGMIKGRKLGKAEAHGEIQRFIERK